MNNVTLLLHDIRSVHNVGSIFRTAECLGVTKIVVSGVTPAPIDRFEKKRADFAKVALGAEDMVPWEIITDAKEYIEAFKQGRLSGMTEKGFVIVLEQDQKSVDYKKVEVPVNTPVLVVLGNEVSGAPQEHLNLANVIAEIPQAGLKESLNVSVAAAIVLFRWFDNRSV
ncbi:MAG: TrmH family RNA methyltransferase [Candidatus Taylorbacteria bacterium]|nr:TrmH family RNA methyltransferase [Candidatus Taylorbacteria bacterium]